MDPVNPISKDSKKLKKKKDVPVAIPTFVTWILPIGVTGLGCIGYCIGLFLYLPFTIESKGFRFLNFVIGTFEFVSFMVAYWKAVLTPCGYVDANWDLDMDKHVVDRLLMYEPSRKGKPRFCAKCGMHKPPRAHHSQYLNKCCKKFDHFCIWINNVVGLNNHKYFFLFLLYATLSWVHFLVMSLFTAIKFTVNPDLFHPAVFVIVLMFTICMMPLGFLLLLFCSWTSYLVATNQTSVEFHNNNDVRSRMRYYRRKHPNHNHHHFQHIYNTSIYQNICGTLGKNPFLWLIPFGKLELLSDGVEYPVIKDVATQNSYIKQARAFPEDSDSETLEV